MPLEIHIRGDELWDEESEQFIQVRERTVHFEYSLAAIAKWEAHWKKPFLINEDLTGPQLLSCVRYMALEQDVTEDDIRSLSHEQVEKIKAYMKDSMTATWFKKDPGKSRRPTKVVTAEIIYYQMVELGIPFECENWHLNRLLTLIAVCAEKQAVPKKMAKKDILSQYANLNAARRAKLGSKG